MLFFDKSHGITLRFLKPQSTVYGGHMKSSLTILLSMATVLISQNSCAEVGTDQRSNQTPDYCVLDKTEPASWSNCDGKMVKITGSRPPPREIMQHPMLDGPRLLVLDEDDNLTLAGTMQSYLNVGDRQIILLSKAPIECEDEITVIGTLESVSLGGPPRTKGSYKGWSIHVSEDSCL